ncbi:twin-arginine translocase subunit TatC [Sessilibacter sp. MAH2]
MTSYDNINKDREQTLVAHLVELRNRLLKGVLSILVVFGVLFAFANDIYAYISIPLKTYLPEGASMIATGVAAPFLTPFKMSMFAAVILAMPFLLFQLWSFIAPALYKHEKRIAIPLLISSVILFYSGMAFAYYVVFPLIFAFFTSAAPAGVTVMTDMSSYLDFVIKLFFAFGFAFEIPVATVLLIWAGITDAKTLANKRPYVIVGCFVVGMLMTPPDIFSQALLAIPMWMLFELGILFGRFIKPRQTDADSEENLEEKSADLH